MSKFAVMNFDFTDLVGDLSALEKVTERAVINTFNVTVRKANKAVVANIRKKYLVTSGFLAPGDPKIKILTARRGRLTAEVFIVADGRGLKVWSAGEVEGGVSATIRRGSSYFRQHAFQIDSRRGRFPVIGIPRKHAARRDGGDKKTITRINRKTGKSYRADALRWPLGPNRATLYGSKENVDLFKSVFNGKDFSKLLNEKYNDQFEKRRR